MVEIRMEGMWTIQTKGITGTALGDVDISRRIIEVASIDS